MNDQQRPYAFSEYDTDWPNQFNAIAKIWKSLLGDTALSIEHIGSTSVPSMQAKPLIDVLVVVKGINKLNDFDHQLKTLGYIKIVDYIAPHSRMYYMENDDGIKTQNIHVFEFGAEKIKDFISMRDYLRNHPDEVIQYSKLKELNYETNPNDYLKYREAKRKYLDELRAKAHNWSNL